MEHPEPPAIASARPAVTAELMARTGLDEAMLDRLVRDFYGRVRGDPVLGPIFDRAVHDWDSHLDRLAAFWSSVALLTGRYHGRPMQKHMPLALEPPHFDRWLALFRATAQEVCPPAGAAHVIAKAEQIAVAIAANIENQRRGNGLGAEPPRL